MRAGFGYDVHRLVKDRKLILGGVEIPYQLGLLGHSDADVLIHAVMDALLGAAGLGDIGKHFPDTNPKYKGICSMLLFEHVQKLLQGKGFETNNIDAVIVAEKPKMAPYIEKMRENIAVILKIPVGRVNVKATTTEGLGFAGTGQGIASYAAVTINEIE